MEGWESFERRVKTALVLTLAMPTPILIQREKGSFGMPLSLQAGDRVIYHAQKCGPRPGSSARGVQPSRRGEDYNYHVPKFWVVEEVLDKCVVVLRTRKGKRRELPVDDPRLRRASLVERILYRSRFP